MDVMQAIASRRSIRKFTDQPVPEDAVRKMLTAATLAPSPKNRQPWRFVAMRPGTVRDRVLDAMRDQWRADLTAIDGYDEATNEAWSVVLAGMARVLHHDDEVEVAEALPLFPWNTDPKTQYVSIEPSHLSGRKFVAEGRHT